MWVPLSSCISYPTVSNEFQPARSSSHAGGIEYEMDQFDTGHEAELASYWSMVIDSQKDR